MSPDSTVLEHSTLPGRRAAPAEPDVVPADRGLRQRYERYCRSQGMALASLVPREAIRPLYRAALEERGPVAGEADRDPVEVLGAFCRTLLPLPPFEVWRDDFLRHRNEHLEATEAWTDMRDRTDPVAVELRTLEAAGERWYATLNVRKDEAGWWGHIAFHTAGSSRAFRTAEVFRETEASAVRGRFRELDPATLAAFLRSVLP